MGREVQVEYTEEFESWWNRLTVGEQERIDAMVNLCAEKARHWGTRGRRRSRRRATATCGSFA